MNECFSLAIRREGAVQRQRWPGSQSIGCIVGGHGRRRRGRRLRPLRRCHRSTAAAVKAVQIETAKRCGRRESWLGRRRGLLLLLFLLGFFSIFFSIYLMPFISQPMHTHTRPPQQHTSNAISNLDTLSCNSYMYVFVFVLSLLSPFSFLDIYYDTFVNFSYFLWMSLLLCCVCKKTTPLFVCPYVVFFCCGGFFMYAWFPCGGVCLCLLESAAAPIFFFFAPHCMCFSLHPICLCNQTSVHSPYVVFSSSNSSFLFLS